MTDSDPGADADGGTDSDAETDPDGASNSDSVTESDTVTESDSASESGGRGWVGHTAVLFAITTTGFALAFGLGDFLSHDWPWIMVETVPAAVVSTTLLVGLIYAVRAGIDG